MQGRGGGDQQPVLAIAEEAEGEGVQNRGPEEGQGGGPGPDHLAAEEGQGAERGWVMMIVLVNDCII